MKQAKFWIGTLAKSECDALDWGFELLVADSALNVDYIQGQEEVGATGYNHYQFYIVMHTKKTLKQMKGLFPLGLNPHLEASRSSAAREYCWKEETRVEGSQFQHGEFNISDI